MILRLPTAAIAAICVVVFAGNALGDVVITRDGKIQPAKVKDDFDPTTVPSNFVLDKSGRANLELTYDSVKIAGQTLSAAEVAEVYSTQAYEDANFNDAEVKAQAGAFEDAAIAYAAAADALKGAAKQIALYKRVMALRQVGDLDSVLAAADDFIKAFPDGYYLWPVQELRARAFISRKDATSARAALAAVAEARQINARDRFAAAVTMIDFFNFKPASQPQQFEQAEKAYRELLRQIEGDTQGRLAPAQRLLCQTRIAQCLLFQNSEAKGAEAQRLLEGVIADPASMYDKTLRGDAFLALGNSIYTSVKAELQTNPTQDRLPKIMQSLDTAALHYLRVTQLYRDYADNALMYDATVNLARVWATQFTIGGEKDCLVGRRAAQHFVQAHNMLSVGEKRRLLVKEAKQFMDRVKEACDVPEDAPTDGDAK